ncbi:hypothetical protein GSI_01398 [Ganoderma sinense ZZ0214-1]|uniref:Integrase catalytic domain-containing protein n=1 Tax=Ganoderma sinense ZZ0214-1 TaxID=1077348 RepID=A0A2G8SVB8_9APHY|nr:hypothetical protein GSI_01398 [Ganoderma sinense ZZ0214-1]
MLKDKGIEIIPSAPHIHQQNGRAERIIRTLMDKSEAMRHDACIPQSWWEFSFEHAAHLHNRTPTRRLEWRTPYELLNGTKPDISHLRVFGCGAYVFLPPEVRKNKLSPKSELMIYLGVGAGNHNHKFMRLPNNVIFTAAQALFDESLFPKCSHEKKRQGQQSVPEPVEPVDQATTPSLLPDDGDEPRRPPTKPSTKGKDISKDIEKRGSWKQMVGEKPSRSRTAPPSRDEQVPGPSYTRSLPQSRQRSAERDPPVPIPPSMRTHREPTPVILSSSSDDEEEEDMGSDPIPAFVLPQPESPAPSPDRSDPDDGDDDDDDEEEEDSSDDEDESEEESSGHSSDEVEGVLRAARTDVAQLCREGGASLIQFLIAKAIPPDEGEKVPPANVREWTYRDIASLPNAERKEWFTACREELEALRRRDVYDLVDRPKGRKVVKNRWVFDVKTDGRKKARLVAKGFSQVEGEDFDKIFSPVVRFETVRLIMALAALEDWHISGLDVCSAYLYGKLDEEIYLEQPEGFRIPGSEHKVFRLKRALYGLKQAGLAWWRTLSESMKLMGYKRLTNDAGLYIYKRHSDGELVVVIVYVDDALFCGRDKKLVALLKARFMKKWECHDLGDAKEFLRMRITRIGRKIFLDQRAYLEKVLDRCGMTNARPALTPLPAGYIPAPNTGQATPELRSRYQKVIGSLLYLMLGTRPDLAFAVTKLAQHAANPTEDHLSKALHICRYLVGTKNYALVYNGDSQLGLIAGTDSDWASDPYTRRSQTGFMLKLANCAFSWVSRAQKTIALSSTEAEYMAMSDCSRQVVWVHNLLAELGYHIGRVPLSGDNQGSIHIGQNPVTESRSKHIDIRYHYIREVYDRGITDIFYVEGTNNPADIFTKNLGTVKFHHFRPYLGLHFPKAA